MLVYEIDAWCVVLRDDEGAERFAADERSFHPLTHAIQVAICLNEAHAHVLIEDGKHRKPKYYANARAVPVTVTISEVSEEEAKAEIEAGLR